MITTLFWFFLALVIYIYLGYPACIFLLSRLFNRDIKKQAYEPSVTILIAAFNEEKDIAETIRNKLAQDYPADKIEIIVISDGSTDRTDEIVRGFAGNGVKLIRQEPRQGKTAALNMAVSQARGEIIVFSDANSIYQDNAIGKLVENFSSPDTGYVTGKMVYVFPDGSMIGSGCNAYMRYENVLRLYESRFNSIVGVDGGIDAIRKELYQPMNPDQLPDFVLPLRVIERGYRVIFEPDAILKEEALDSEGSEYRMRVRVSLRSLWALWDMRALLNPFRFPVFSWQLFSHKVLRYLAWLPVSLSFILNLFLIQSGPLFQSLMGGQIFFYILAFTGYLKKHDKSGSSTISAPYYFALINIAAAHAAIQFLKGKKQILWNPRTG